MNSNTSQQTSRFKVKIRHKNDAVKRLYWALINNERDTGMKATTVILAGKMAKKHFCYGIASVAKRKCDL